MSDIPSAAPAPSFEAAPIAPPVPAQGAEFGLKPASPAETAKFQLQTEQQTRENNIFKSVGQWVGEKFSKPTTNPQETIKELSKYDLAADKDPVIKHLKLNGFTDDEIAIQMSKMNLGEGGVSNVVLEQQKGLKLQTEAAGMAQKMQSGMETATVTQAERLKLQQEKMSPTVRAQQDERRTFNQQVEGAVTQAKIEQNKPADATAPKVETTPVQSLDDIEVVSSTTASPKIETSTDATQPIVVEGPSEIRNPTSYVDMEGPSGTQNDGTSNSTEQNQPQATAPETSAKNTGNGQQQETKTPKERKKRTTKPNVEATPATQPTEAIPSENSTERFKQYTKEALAKRTISPEPKESDFAGNTLEYKKAVWAWRGEQATAIKNIENDAQIMVEMEDWEKTNQPPTADKNSTEYSDWVKKADEHRQQLENQYKSAKQKDADTTPSTQETINMLQNDESARALAQELARAMQQQKDAKTPAEKQAAAQAQKDAEDKDPKKAKSILALLGLLGFVVSSAIKNTAAQA